MGNSLSAAMLVLALLQLALAGWEWQLYATGHGGLGTGELIGNQSDFSYAYKGRPVSPPYDSWDHDFADAGGDGEFRYERSGFSHDLTGRLAVGLGL